MASPWINLPGCPDYILPQDTEVCGPFTGSTCKPEHKLRLELLPEPFIGNPRAKVILLNLNPGFAETDLEDFNAPLLRDLLLRCIREEPTEFPFYYLHPDCSGGGASWWMKRLRTLMNELDAMTGVRRQRLANSIAVHEYFPYHSLKFAHERLRSVSLDYQLDCIRQALSTGSVVVGMRSRRLWSKVLPELEENPQVFWCRNVQQPYITPANLGDGFEKLVEVLRPCVS
mgnify:CR=1 FL=1